MEIQIIMTFCSLIQQIEQLHTEVFSAAIYDRNFAEAVVEETLEDAMNNNNYWEDLSEEANSSYDY